ncbi:ATP synthase F0 subcomplex A subunit [Desulforamulus reducens MI-1]|uniref:ATP synthase subunit a n=1 Tax=Desulforamulus reducens (strain ATCC BAA-1160 / DSM 100696 / MI-1) TaxID=349161 RepID=ATP6_DESRM|nr:F0F1 ATP synthase subunit A [Desulforamulus reducens]A4J9A5.1 RecName: Full=ATP synthase subunit a; AltName: Full=ATP synthase F0 sector subunit a; AltName: Full=F-ATPase subunit 6 [Desulforamulus reducens MI-1]ABO51658.1 ATP synthase F0 subcomplex A subunit [Desulforamulus reducens MI-1]
MSAAAGAAQAAEHHDMLHMVEMDLNFWNIPLFTEYDKYWHIMGLSISPRTMIMTWITMALVLLFAWACTKNQNVRSPGKAQATFEVLWEFLGGQVFSNLGNKLGAAMMPIIVTFFIYIVFANLLGLIPTLSSPTADKNTTFGLALIVVLLIHYHGLKANGVGGHIGHYFQPFKPFVVIHLIEEIARPVTLAFRLYGNIFAGEVLIAVLLGLININAYVFGGFIPSVIWLAFSVFVGFVQAFVFSMLTIAYVSQFAAHEADHH